MVKLTVNTERCKGCGFCVEFCPKKAITLSEDSNSMSYHYVQVDRSACILCGTCYTACPDLVYELIEC